MGNCLAKVMRWLGTLGRLWPSHPPRQLHLRETLALGERRFIAVVEFERQKFLIAGTGSSVGMLAALPSGRSVNEKLELAALQEQVPTWQFVSQGPSQQLVRR